MYTTCFDVVIAKNKAERNQVLMVKLFFKFVLLLLISLVVAFPYIYLNKLE